MRKRSILVLVAGLVLIGGTIAIVVALARRGDGGPDISGTIKDGTPQVSKSTGGTEGGPETISDGLADRFAPLLGEVRGGSRVNVPDTFAMNLSTFASSYLFVNNDQGEKLANQWKILDGFQVNYEPKGLGADALQGKYYVTVETYLFAGADGAKAAYEHMAKLYAANNATVVQKAKGLGNQSSGYALVQGTIATSEIPAVYHRFLFRRGNVVAVVQTLGGNPYMSIDQARDLAVTIDDKILGKRPATNPTPIPTPSFGGN
jgi:hypothetical protein